MECAAFKGAATGEWRHKSAQPLGAVPGGGADSCVDPTAADCAVAELAHLGLCLASPHSALRGGTPPIIVQQLCSLP